MKLKFLVWAVACMASAVVFGKSAAKGSCISKAISLKSSQTARLVQEYDPEEEEKEDRYLENGAAYYKMELKRGQAYTVWITGGDAEEIELDVDTNWEYYDKDSKADKEPSAGFDIFEIDGGATQVAYLYSDDWDFDEEEGDPKKGKYIVYLYGDNPGMTTTLGFTTGIKQFTIVGSEESPKVISMGARRTFSGKLVDGEYNFRTSLKAGRKYRIRTLGGKKTAELSLDIGSSINEDSDDDDNDEWVATDTARLTSYNDAVIVVPEMNGKYDIVVSGEGSQAFKLQYEMVPTRKITAHPAIPLLPKSELPYDVEGKSVSYSSYTATFVPGRMANTHNYYDEIVDDNLCKIYLGKGQTWAFETEGATNAQHMVVYSPSGKVLGTNDSLGNGAFDTRVVITASAAGVYYVGVCNPNLEVEDIPQGKAITLTAHCTDGSVSGDDFDPADNVLAGASVLVPYPATTNDWATALASTNDDVIALGSVHGSHWFDSGDLYDVFAFACRKGYTYKVRAEFDNPDDGSTDLTLTAKVFNINGKKERAVTCTGTLTPVGDNVNFDDDDLTFKANTNAVHYVRVWVNEGKGLDFPAYKLKVIGANGTNNVALLRVVSEGADGTWSVNSEKFSYLSGTTLTIAPTAALSVKANAVSGFTAPSAQTVALTAWKAGDPVVTVTNRYTDIYDKKYQTGTKTTKKNGKPTTTKLYSPENGDATADGAFAITPAATAKTLKRTLWNNDTADYFKLTAVTNVYYNFSVASTLSNGSGDAVITVSNATAGVLYEGTEITRALLPVGVNYVIVKHGTEAKADTAYALTFSKAAGGIVRFTNAKGAATSEFTVNETAAAATLYVARTGTEGVTRVVYATQAGTALPGKNYYPVLTNEVRWAAGDKAVKAIKVNLIPEPTAAWALSNLTFTVKLLPVDEYASLEEGENFAIIPQDTATVTIKNTSAKQPGTVALASFVVNDVTNAVSNVKTPVVTGTAGQELTLTFTRTGGTDGPVSVKVASPTAAVAKKNKDTALADADYEAFDTQLDWEDGDDAPKTVTVNLLPSANYAASKKFIFNIATVKTDGTLPTLAAKTATLTILNDTVAETAAAYAKTIAAATGLKLASTGTWFNDTDGALRSGAVNGTLTYTLTGPGFFACTPTVVTANPEDAATLTCQFVNKTAKLNETVTDFSGRLARVIPAGTTTVKFTLSGVTGGAYVKFTPQADGSPYVWGRFADVTSAAWTKDGMPALMDKSVVKKDDVQTLAWALPAVLASESNLYCRVRWGTTAKPTEIRGYDKDHEEAVPPIDPSYEDGKTYYWALDYAYYTAVDAPSYDVLAALPWTPGPSTWSFSTLKDGAPVTAINLDDEDPSQNPKDMAGRDVAKLVAKGDPIELIQGVNVKSLEISLEGAGEGDAALTANMFRLVGGTLPKGVTINATTGLLTGAPTTVGTYTALLQGYSKVGTTVKKKVNGKTKNVTTYTTTYGTTLPVVFNVLPAGSMIGSFRGTLVEDGSIFATDSRHVGNLTVTATAAGKITAKAVIAGITYTFSGTAGFDELLDRDEDLPGCTRHVQVELTTTVKTLKGKKVTGTYKDNSLTLKLADGALTNAVALAEAVGTAELSLHVLNSAKTAVTPDVVYKADLCRNNGTVDIAKPAFAEFSGYYTAALVPEGVTAADGVPVGNGYLTFTVADSGTVKVSGVLADGTAVSFSTFGQLIGDGLDTPRACVFAIPVYVGKATCALAGTVCLAFGSDDEAALPVVRSAEKLVWMKNAAAATSRDKTGFAIDLAPTGGWYDKVVNLQTYYINRGFAISSVESGDDLPAEALAKGYSFSTLSAPHDLEVKFAGNALSVAARKLVKSKTTGLSDFAESVNPWNTTVKFNRATGIVSGTFNAWEWVIKNDLTTNYYASAQKQITSLAHKGVLLFSRDDSGDSPLADDVFTAGFFLMPATNSTKASVKKAAWKASFPFNILVTSDAEPLWDEREESQP